MKLTIENINKIYTQNLPQHLTKGLWEVHNVSVTDTEYHFLMQRWWGSKVNYVCNLTIVRESEKFFSGESVFDGRFDIQHLWLIKIDGNKTIHYLTQSQLRDMNKVMEQFAQILNRIPF
jgi:hypothetical protein